MLIRARSIAYLSLVVVAAATLTFLAVPRPAVAAPGLEDEAKQLTKVDEAWSAAAGKRDADLVASFYAEDGLAYPPNQPLVKGRAACKKLWEGMFSDASVKISWKSLKSEVVGELGYTTAAYEVSFNTPEGKPGKEVGKCVCIWKKQKDGSWKAIHDIWNADAK